MVQPLLCVFPYYIAPGGFGARGEGRFGMRSAGKVFACRKRAKTLRWARGREGCSDSPLPTSGLHPPRNGPRAARP
ncbi:MAG: hypothetical protein EGQ85_03935 [Faecalibacterium prausnitzii]|nr:hypothetical protein [Faecalibacterium prausnitzii]